MFANEQDHKPIIKKASNDRVRRSKGRGRGNYRRSGNNTRTITAKFKGDTEEQHGLIYDVGVTNQSEIFTATTKKIASYAGRNCKEP